MSKYQPVTLDFSSEYLKHICLDAYQTKTPILKWMIHKHWYAVFDNAESSISAHCIIQLIIVCSIVLHIKN